MEPYLQSTPQDWALGCEETSSRAVDLPAFRRQHGIRLLFTEKYRCLSPRFLAR